MTDYQATAGQTYMPARENTEIDVLPYERLSRPQPEYPPLELNAMAQEKSGCCNPKHSIFFPA